MTRFSLYGSSYLCINPLKIKEMEVQHRRSRQNWLPRTLNRELSTKPCIYIIITMHQRRKTSVGRKRSEVLSTQQYSHLQEPCLPGLLVAIMRQPVRSYHKPQLRFPHQLLQITDGRYNLVRCQILHRLPFPAPHSQCIDTAGCLIVALI